MSGKTTPINRKPKTDAEQRQDWTERKASRKKKKSKIKDLREGFGVHLSDVFSQKGGRARKTGSARQNLKERQSR